MSEVHLLQGDCLEIMRTMADASVDAVITDPPYIGLKGGVSLKGTGVTDRTEDSLSVGDPWGANLDWMNDAWRICRYGMLVFCSHHFIGAVQSRLSDYVVGLVTWYKRNAPLPQNNVPHFNSEFIWLFKKAPGLNWKALDTFYDIPIVQAGCFASERILQPGTGKAAHPTQKPELLMRHLLTINAKSVLDPFMGTGTTGTACIRWDIDFTGIEKNPEYFAIAERRITDAQMQMVLPL